MSRGTVIAVDAGRRLFALQITQGSAAVFSQHSGSPVAIGNVLMGYVGSTGFRMFAHCEGFCRAHFEAGPLDNADALRLVHSAWAVPVPVDPSPFDPIATPEGVPALATERHHVERTVFP